MKKICDVCKGNGFIRVPYEQAREEQFADCEFCNNQGEVEVEEEKMAQPSNEGKIKFLQDTCRRAGAEIRELKDTVAKLEKLVGITSEDVVNKLRDAENYGRMEDQ